MRIRELIEKACVKNNVSTAFADTIKVEWNDRFTARIGDADYVKLLIRFSVPLFHRAPIEEQENTVVHEACHIIARHKFGKSIKSHGSEWKSCMIIAGYEPTRCHDVNRSGLVKTRKTYPTSCRCPEPHMVTQKVWLRLATKTHNYGCHKCGGNLSLILNKA